MFISTTEMKIIISTGFSRYHYQDQTSSPSLFYSFIKISLEYENANIFLNNGTKFI